ncbi:hypothetical protein R9C00_28995 [Flammeovirgaceae bacterium SG7u.111]|nr:hypothetical protein [Flammeovirgaceae bacterium SG7u.132]WPO35737.1 hypothetical protein R9C00_28995 [Flammeovirgaceae bacterium SG7u.111]
MKPTLYSIIGCVLAINIILTSGGVVAQPAQSLDTLGLLLTPGRPFSSDISQSNLQARLDKSIKKLNKVKNRTGLSKRLVSAVKNELFGEYLKEYMAQSSFGETISQGKYDCLTSSILYAYFFEQLGFDYKVYELNYHLYLLINLEKKDILIEPTAPLYSILINQKDISNRIEEYISTNKEQLDKYYENDYEIHKPASFDQLIGLHFFNLGVRSFNVQNYTAALQLTHKSKNLYPNERTKELEALCIAHIMAKDPEEKKPLSVAQ